MKSIKRPFIFLVFSGLIHIALLCTYLQKDKTAAITNYAQDQGQSQLAGVISVRIKDAEKTTPPAKKNTRNAGLITQRLKPAPSTTNLPSSKGQTHTGEESYTARYLSQVRDNIEKNKYKSPIAQRLKLTGKVGVSFKIAWPNQIKDIKVTGASQHKALNYSALESIKLAKNLPLMPPEMEEENLAVNLQIVYE